MQDLEHLRQAKNITSLKLSGQRNWSMIPEGYKAISLPLLTSLTLMDQSAIISSFFHPQPYQPQPQLEWTARLSPAKNTKCDHDASNHKISLVFFQQW